jgi:heat shock protein HspQ
MSETARFSIGDLVHHKMFEYRGVVVDIDSRFMLTEEWYDKVAQSRPPKDEPWYHVLVHNATHNTYVAERNLEADTNSDPIQQPLIDLQFSKFKNVRYVETQKTN